MAAQKLPLAWLICHWSPTPPYLQWEGENISRERDREYNTKHYYHHSYGQKENFLNQTTLQWQWCHTQDMGNSMGFWQNNINLCFKLQMPQIVSFKLLYRKIVRKCLFSCTLEKHEKRNELLHSENLTKLYCLSLKFKIEVILYTFTTDFYLLYCNNKLLYQKKSSNLVFIIFYRNSNVRFIRKKENIFF